MEVVVIEKQAYEDLLRMHKELSHLMIEETEYLNGKKVNKYWGVKDVMQFTGFSKDWVLARKEHFGFFQDGKDVKFLKSNVIKYMDLKSVVPKMYKKSRRKPAE